MSESTTAVPVTLEAVFAARDHALKALAKATRTGKEIESIGRRLEREQAEYKSAETEALKVKAAFEAQSKQAPKSK